MLKPTSIIVCESEEADIFESDAALGEKFEIIKKACPSVGGIPHPEGFDHTGIKLTLFEIFNSLGRIFYVVNSKWFAIYNGRGKSGLCGYAHKGW